MSKRFAFILVISVILFSGFLIFGKKDTNTPNNSSSSRPTSHTKGQGKSGVVLVEYGDFQCSACYAYEPVIKEIFSTYNEQITFQFRNFPLVQIHKNALVASRAAEAAALQGKFWEMHDKLYETQDPSGKTGWVVADDPVSYFAEIAAKLGMNVEKFKTDLKSSAVNDSIQADIKEGQALDFSGTPSFVLDGKRIEKNPADLQAFKKLIEDTIKAKTGQ
ncbi:thioredoxin domain-containing protein [Candidatus Saccharibacteria bacterium]|nr:thioredoxin domain-containing protein [Candidatus Saccharibacteria bacterium]MBI3337726.1 thioredoxin domain-containing protein [Candidatus Saccharibacteria bacterium]